MDTTQQERNALERAEFIAQVLADMKRDIEAMHRFNHTWAMQQLLLKREMR
jgi:hypothetical protein